MAILLYILPATLIPLAGFFSAIHLIIKRYDTKELQSEFKEILENSGYFEGISATINTIFGEGHTSRVVDVPKEEAIAFSHAEHYTELLCKHFGLTINGDTLSQLKIFYRWIGVLDRICDEHPEFENFRETAYPTFFVRYISRNGKEFAVGKLVFDKVGIESLYEEIWLILYENSEAVE